MKFLFGSSQGPVQYFVYIEWFKIQDRKPRPTHALYRVNRSYNAEGERVASIISLDAIQRSVHLYPQFGQQSPKEWTWNNVLDLCDHFLINSFSDRYAHYTMK